VSATGGLIVRSDDPLNAETPLSCLRQSATPNDLFYVRNHFPCPTTWDGSLTITGEVDRLLSLSVADLAHFAQTSITTTMECAGNGREVLDPPVSGVQWALGAVSTASWSGVRLSDLLDDAGSTKQAREIIFSGADSGLVDGGEAPISFERSLPIEVARNETILVATHMNNEPVPRLYGGPVRLIVPRWYGMASVKWLRRIDVRSDAFKGHFQVVDYVVRTDSVAMPCSVMNVRSIILAPRDEEEVSPGGEVTGLAWSGRGAVSRVELSVDGGLTWIRCYLNPASEVGVWQEWSTHIPPAALAGSTELIVRATDESGSQQPLDQVWNSRGYCNNSCHRVLVTISR
jgi:sulfite oxidase